MIFTILKTKTRPITLKSNKSLKVKVKFQVLKAKSIFNELINERKKNNEQII